MERITRTVAVLAALALLAGAASDARAGWRLPGAKKPGTFPRTEMPEEYREPHRFDNLPEMGFLSGTLRREGLSGWWVGDYRLELVEQSVIIGPDGQAGSLQEGREVVVMGPRYGNTYMGWNVRVVGGDPLPPPRRSLEKVLKPSDSDPDVGEIVSGPQ